MKFFEIINFHSFSIGAIIPFIFFVFTSLFLVSIKNKSKAAKHFTLASIFMAIFYFGYVIASCICHPISAYHRWFTVGSILYASIHFFMFILYFSSEKEPAFAKKYLIISYAFSTILIMLFYVKTIGANIIIYNFDAHYWDFNEYTLTKIISYVIQFFIANLIIIGIWRFLTIKRPVRWVILMMFFSIVGGSVVPAIANSLSRYGVLSRDIYHFTLVLFNVFSFLLLLLLYINNSEERISFLAKIISIMFVTFLVLMQFIGYFLIQEKETSYDQEHKIITAYILKGGNLTNDFKYLVKYSFHKQKIEKVIDHDNSLDMDTMQQEFINTYIYEKIKSPGEKNDSYQLEKLFEINNIYIEGYKNVIKNLIKVKNENHKNLSDKVIKYLDSIKSEIHVNYKKIEMLHASNFKFKLKKHLAESKPDFQPFKVAIEKFYQSSELDGDQLKSEVLKFLLPMDLAGKRNYRSGKKQMDHYIGFMHMDKKSEELYEVGYDYYKYRKVINNTILKILLIFGLIILFVRYGFVFFYINIIVRPLNKLRKGVYQVERGNLNINIPVQIEDEIGFITHAFNSMVHSVKDVTENLESKVEERTSELQAARDELWGEMQVAKKIQSVLLPEYPQIKGYDIAAYMNPADEVGGDYYDVINFPTKDWVVIGDVSGHGVPASLIMIMIRTSIRTFLNNNSDVRPSDLLESVNGTMRESLKKIEGNPFMMINALSFSLSGEIIYSGRHTSNILYRNKSKKIELIEPVGIVISDFDLGEKGQNQEINIYPGDTILLYTDGIVEAQDCDKKFYGEKYLIDVFSSCAEKSPEIIINTIIESLKDYYCEDDVSIVVIKKREV